MLFCRLGTIDYEDAHRVQRQLQAKRIAEEIEDTVLLLEHSPVFSLGRSAKELLVLASTEVLEGLGF